MLYILIVEGKGKSCWLGVLPCEGIVSSEQQGVLVCVL